MHRGSSVRGDAARLAMIVAAERLFAERGYRAVSMREVGAAAGQKNNSAAQYHFGSRRGLLEAILELRMTPINERRLEILAEMAAGGRSHDLRSLVEALAVPWIEMAEEQHGETYYARFLSHVAFLPGVDFLDLTKDRPYVTGFRIVEEGLLHSMDQLPRVVAAQRMEMVNRLLVSAMADHELMEAAGDGQPWQVAAATDLIDLAVAMITAPVSDETLLRVAELTSGVDRGNGVAKEGHVVGGLKAESRAAARQREVPVARKDVR